MRNTNKRIMFDCFTSSHSVYFEEALDTEFRKQYKGVIVNARGYDGHGHFAIRKPEMDNPSSRELTFNKDTYEDLKACIPPFLKYVKYKFTTETTDDGLTLTFEPVTAVSRYNCRKK